MSNKKQRENRAKRRELWRDDMLKLNLKEMTLGVWRWEKGCVDFYPSKLRAYKYMSNEWLPWEYALSLVIGEQR